MQPGHRVADRGDVLTPVRVGGGGDHAGRLVQQGVREPLPRNLLSVDLDAIAGPDDRVELSGLAIDGDAACLDQLIGAPARRDSGAGEERVQTHPEKIRALPHYISLIRWTSQGRMGLPAWRDR